MTLETPGVILYKGIQPMDYTDESDCVCYNDPETKSTCLMPMFYFNIKYKKTDTVWDGQEVYQHIDSHVSLPKRNDNIEELLWCADAIQWMDRSMKERPKRVQERYREYKSEVNQYLAEGCALIEDVTEAYMCCYEEALFYYSPRGLLKRIMDENKKRTWFKDIPKRSI